MLSTKCTPTNSTAGMTRKSSAKKLVVDPPGVLANDINLNPNARALTAHLVSGPSHGSLLLNEDGSFSYTPASTYHGEDSFRYQVSDGTHWSVLIGEVMVDVG